MTIKRMAELTEEMNLLADLLELLNNEQREFVALTEHVQCEECERN